MSHASDRGALHDEQGAVSSARLLLWIVVPFTLLVILLDAALEGFSVPNAGYQILGALSSALVLWAGGPRAMQYLGPQLGAMVSTIGSALRDKRLPSHDDDESVD